MNWQPSPSELFLDHATVHVWRIDLACDLQRQNELAAVLSSSEAERACRFHFPQDQRRYRVAHGAMRNVLSAYLGCTPQSLNFHYTDRGKPYLPQFTDIYFNLSHSHELALLAVTRFGEVGVDIEHHRQLDDLDQLASRCFSDHEYDQLASLEPREDQTAFFDCWTRKEAFIKAVGDGLAYPLDQFTVSILPNEPSRLICVEGDPDEADQWTVLALEPGMDYSAALAIRKKTMMVKYWDWA